ncbi:MAG TPA: SpoIIIAH-like family protein [Bacillota bacterium]|nr:SpoIIIAH-like family protein [Bacillota bacterium]
MVLKKQTVWLLSMLTIMVVLSAYYLVQGPIKQVPVALDGKQKVEKQKVTDVQVDSKQVTTGNKVTTAIDASDYFVGVKMDRDAWNSKQMEEYMTVMTSNEAKADSIGKAKQSYDKLVSLQETEMNVENLIKALGYKEAVVVSKDDRVNVIVQADKVEKNKVVEIMSLVKKHMDVPGQNIVVSYKP